MRQPSAVAPEGGQQSSQLGSVVSAGGGERLSVLQLGKGWFPEEQGGLNRFYHELIRHLPAAGVDATGLVCGSPAVALGSAGVVRAVCPAHVSMAQRWMRWRSRIRQTIAEEDAPVVASHFALYTYPVLDLLGSLPLVVHFQGPWALESKREGAGRVSTRVRLTLERTVYRRGQMFLVLSKAFGQVLHETYAVPEDRIRVVPGGVDVDRFGLTISREAARKALGWPTDRPVVVSVRRLVRRMGLENLLEAARLVRRRVPDALFVLVGQGALMGELEARVRSLGLGEHVRLFGRAPDAQLPLIYRAADLSVVPSVAFEGFGLVVAESLAAGTPVLVTPVGGLPEVLSDLAPRLVLPETGVGALADGLAEFLTGRLGAPDAEACRGFARDRYSWPLVARQVAAAYGEARRAGCPSRASRRELQRC